MFENYGDVNFFEYGRLVEKAEDINCFIVLVCNYNYVYHRTDPERCFQFDVCYVDTSDSWIDVDAVESYAECSKESEPELFAIACIDYYGVRNFGGTAYYVFTESELKEKLKSYEVDETIEL